MKITKSKLKQIIKEELEAVLEKEEEYKEKTPGIVDEEDGSATGLGLVEFVRTKEGTRAATENWKDLSFRYGSAWATLVPSHNHEPRIVLMNDDGRRGREIPFYFGSRGEQLAQFYLFMLEEINK